MLRRGLRRRWALNLRGGRGARLAHRVRPVHDGGCVWSTCGEWVIRYRATKKILFAAMDMLVVLRFARRSRRRFVMDADDKAGMTSTGGQEHRAVGTRGPSAIVIPACKKWPTLREGGLVSMKLRLGRRLCAELVGSF
jgi:hypothetical protein